MQASAETIWAAAQEHLRSKLTPDTYNLWFAPLRASAQESNTIVLEVRQRLLRSLAKGQLRQFAPGRYRGRVRAAAGHQIQSWPRRDCGPGADSRYYRKDKECGSGSRTDRPKLGVKF